MTKFVFITKLCVPYDPYLTLIFYVDLMSLCVILSIDQYTADLFQKQVSRCHLSQHSNKIAHRFMLQHNIRALICARAISVKVLSYYIGLLVLLKNNSCYIITIRRRAIVYLSYTYCSQGVVILCVLYPWMTGAQRRNIFTIYGDNYVVNACALLILRPEVVGVSTEL